MRPLSILFPRNLRASFTRHAKLAFPNETFAFCLGHKEPSGALIISHLHYPPINLAPSGLAFEVPVSSYVETVELCSFLETKILASVHSHPYPESCRIDDCAPSETDWDYLSPEMPLGICSVVQRNGKLKARYRFWPRLKPIRLTSCLTPKT